MMEKRKSRMHLPTIDDLFTTEEERQIADLEKVINIKLDEIDDFPEHPFKIVINDEMQDMVDSIKEKGVLSPTLVRPKPDGRYEMISGHRRKKASEILKLETIPCIVRELTDDEATIIMVDSNLQRETLLPSEKAFAYKMKMEALNHQGKETSRPVVDKLKSADILGQENGESGRQVHRYIRLTNLIPKLLEYVDNAVIKDKEKLSIAFRPAVELSYLTENEQNALLDYLECYECTPSLQQAIHLKEYSQKGILTPEKIEEEMDIEKPNLTPKLKVSMNRLNSVLPQSLKNDREREEYVIKAVEFYDKYQKRMREKQNFER